ncbi:arylsulfatase [Phragmitibacter flavus]|uniref:Arylsulfatase n=1 Tax=Phragmitibacter flavus TaxID=2576071 RepID=A0A5R8KJM8_9BACT|nr:arylsulfatase [Phragmitibacter flavus]TLD71819.1 arylsulfatase [Phragmitibacter flavus]
MMKWLVWLLMGGLVTGVEAQERPNVVVILVDDMGFSDVGCYGGEIPTPNLDRLAAEGVRFSQFYNAGRCCPSRASLLTGLYSHQAGIGHMAQDRGLPAYRGALNDRCVTLAEVLREAGYFTAHTGKWHVGDRDESMWPLQRGFDRFYGSPTSNASYFGVKKGRMILSGNERLYDHENPPPEGWHSTDAWTSKGLEFVDEALKEKKPFFWYLAHNAPHFPLQAEPEDIARFRGKYRKGWDKVREERHARQQELVLMKGVGLSARDESVQAWEALDEQQKDELDLRMAIYAAVVERLDKSIGVLVEGLKARGVFENTLLMFLSDNGASDEGGVYGKFGDGDGEPGSLESDVYAGRAWANASDTPFRLYKSFTHEGGIATPLVVHWPAGLKARGEWRHEVGHVVDVMPTLVELCGAAYPKSWKAREILPMEGSSLAAVLQGEKVQGRTLFWEHEGNAAVREGDWKLVRSKREGLKWRLYDLKEDRTELKDVSAGNAAKVEELRMKWKGWAERVGVVPFHELQGGMKK